MTLAWRGVTGSCAILAACVAASAGCGSDWHSSCGHVLPCGGDLVGNWSFKGGCLNEAAVTEQAHASCPQGTIDVLEVSASGSVAFNADLTYAAFLNRRTTARETFPLSCQPTATSCAALTQSVTTETQTLSASCTGGTDCDCTVSLIDQGTTDAGNYSITGTSLQTDGALGTPSYCVQGGTLHFVALTTTMNMAMGAAVISSDLVAQRQ